MTPKAARKLLRKYQWAMAKHGAGIESAPKWLLRLWRKCTKAALA